MDAPVTARPRILMLVPHEPDDDPRIAWVTRLCADIGETSILGTTWSTSKSMREYRDETYLERISVPELASGRARALWSVGSRLQGRRFVSSYLARRALWRTPDGALAERVHSRASQAAAVTRFAAAWSYYWMIVDALYRRARTESIRPDVVVCHDLFGLIVGVRLKKMWETPLLYDAHEFWPQADLLFEPWEERLLTRLERRLVRSTDQVVTVSPPLARHLERLYDLRSVLSVPNATPRAPAREVCVNHSDRVTFLLQGQVAPGRGIELLLEAWSTLGEPRAVLQLRYRANPYSRELEKRYASLIASGRVEVLAPVSEEVLVDAASRSDVGIAPYIGPNLNHVFACPNKVSQYMQAGLAILAAEDMIYVRELVARYACGLCYEPRDPTSLHRSVISLVNDRAQLTAMKRNAVAASSDDYNWETVSAPYSEAIARLAHRRTITVPTRATA